MDWRVRFINYPAAFAKMEAETVATVRMVLAQGDLMLRQQLRDFEAEFAAFVGTRYAIGVSNCTDGLHLAIRAAGIGVDDEVITVSHTFVATAAAIHHAGATPVLVDIGDDHNMNVDLVEAAVTPRTRAVVPVHLNGRVCDMAKLMALAERRDLVVIEDSAQALGGSFKGTRGGAFGLAGCFSFYPAKLLGAYGDAGAVVTNDTNVAERIRRLRDHGRTANGEIAEWSFNCRMDNLQAALLSLKLPKLPEWIARRRELAAIYHHELSGLPELRLPPPPVEDGLYFDVFQNYETEAADRDRLVAHLKAQGVEILVPWGGKAIHHSKALGFSDVRLPRTDRLFREVLMLPMHTELTGADVRYVCECVRRFYGR
jgi:dTDP-4-amino-4,6-dideoxygalactose transaminase